MEDILPAKKKEHNAAISPTMTLSSFEEDGEYHNCTGERKKCKKKKDGFVLAKDEALCTQPNDKKLYGSNLLYTAPVQSSFEGEKDTKNCNCTGETKMHEMKRRMHQSSPMKRDCALNPMIIHFM